MPIKDKLSRKKVEEFENSILPADHILIATHDFPDPDCIGSALGLKRLLQSWGISNITVTYGGFIGRAENRAMVKLLGMNIIPIQLLEPDEYDKIILLDASPGNGNISLPDSTHINAVIDHHDDTSASVDFIDIRPDTGATSTIIASYLFEDKCSIPARIATALFYGIKTDTKSLSRKTSELDRSYYKYLFEIMDHSILVEIETPEKDQEYFRIMHNSIEAFEIFGNTGYSHIGRISTPDYVAEISDFLNSLEHITMTVTTGIFNHMLFFSVRTKNGVAASLIAERIAKDLNGTGGGHPNMAAGRIPTQKKEEQTIRMFKERLLSFLNLTDERTTKILPAIRR